MTISGPSSRTSSVMLENGVRPGHRDAAAALYWQAFQSKLTSLLSPEPKAVGFLRRAMNPGFAISAVSAEERLLGLAGFKTAQGAFLDGAFADLRAEFGPLGAVWRGWGLSLLERPVVPGTLLMDGLMVTKAARGQGVGTQLLHAIKSTARAQRCNQVRLDVIDTNPKARALYLREGFVPRETVNLGPLRLLFGFRSATTMTCAV